jgi:hypothetical protein
MFSLVYCTIRAREKIYDIVSVLCILFFTSFRYNILFCIFIDVSLGKYSKSFENMKLFSKFENFCVYHFSLTLVVYSLFPLVVFKLHSEGTHTQHCLDFVRGQKVKKENMKVPYPMTSDLASLATSPSGTNEGLSKSGVTTPKQQIISTPGTGGSGGGGSTPNSRKRLNSLSLSGEFPPESRRVRVTESPKIMCKKVPFNLQYSSDGLGFFVYFCIGTRVVACSTERRRQLVPN